MGKEVASIEVCGGEDFWLDPKPYQAFIRTLGHVFRNAVAHGLETPEERWEAEKDEVGRIFCSVSLVSSTIKLSIADDGAGIDLAAIRKRAMEVGLLAADEVLALSDEDVVSLIFRDRMSTRNAVTRFAGRGVGLSAVLAETSKLGGQVVVNSLPGKGTEFLFTMPMRHVVLGKNLDFSASDSLLEDEIGLVMHSVVDRMREYFRNEHGMVMTDAPAGDGRVEGVELLGPTAIIGLEGRFNLQVVLSVEDRLASTVYEWMTDGFGEAPGDAQEHRQGAVAELLNIVLGQCTTDLEHLDRQGIGLTSPLIIDQSRGLLVEHGRVCCHRRYVTERGRLDIMLHRPGGADGFS